MALPFHLVFVLCLTGGLLISGTRSASIERRAAGCRYGWTAWGNRCYMVQTYPQTMASAEHICIALGGNLASIHSWTENNFVRSLIRRRFGRDVDALIGLFDAVQEGRWMWTDGSRVDYTNWSTREPNNVGRGENCVSIKHYGNPKWNDVPCRYRYPYVCARDH